MMVPRGCCGSSGMQSWLHQPKLRYSWQPWKKEQQETQDDLVPQRRRRQSVTGFGRRRSEEDRLSSGNANPPSFSQVKKKKLASHSPIHDIDTPAARHVYAPHVSIAKVAHSDTLLFHLPQPPSSPPPPLPTSLSRGRVL
ncbi:hypothetical protein BHE74_00018579 [Ensete ventricosum]|nr:hypothetical protein BHE74_00018579 [Ensete ventricosum]